MLKEHICVLEIKGKGDTKEKAFNDVFSQIKPYIAKKFTEAIVVKIEPVEIEVVSACEKVYTERFLWLFFPRKRTWYDITVSVTVQLKLVELCAVSFTTAANQSDTLIRKILHEN